jgi:hypothetical protein
LPQHNEPISKIKCFEYVGEEHEEEKSEEPAKKQKKQKKKTKGILDNRLINKSP